jgi:small subunit ribosomal protein S1
VLSRRAFLEESQSEGRKKFLEGLQKGERRKGTVSSIVNFGAFVDLGGVDGLVHVSELSWKHVDHPSEVVTVGQEVEVEVLDVDLERERVSLSLKATQEDPWKEFERTSTAGSVIEGQVTKLVPFGAFVRVAPGIEGLVHISELSHEHVDTPESVLSVGDTVTAKVIDVDVQRRRVSLSMRQVTEKPRQPEIQVEEAPPAVEAAPEMAPAGVAIPQEIVDAVAEAEAAAADAPVVEAMPEEPSEAPADAEAPVADETAEEPAPEAAPAEAPAEGAPADAEVSLEAILEDLKRREGRSE